MQQRNSGEEDEESGDDSEDEKRPAQPISKEAVEPNGANAENDSEAPKEGGN